MSNEETLELIQRLRDASGVQTHAVNERVALMDEAARALECLSVPAVVPPVTREALLALIVAHDPDDSHPNDQRRCICGELIGESDGVSVTTDPYGHLVDCILKSLSVSPPAEVEQQYRRVKPDGYPRLNAVFETMPELDEGWTVEHRVATYSEWVPVVAGDQK